MALTEKQIAMLDSCPVLKAMKSELVSALGGSGSASSGSEGTSQNTGSESQNTGSESQNTGSEGTSSSP